MSDSPPVLPPPSHPPSQDDPVPGRGLPAYAAVPAALHDAWLVPRSWALVVAALAAAGLLGSAALWQKLGAIQEELAGRTNTAGAQSIEARTLAQDAQESTREQSVRLALLETRLGEISLQRSQLEELMQSLTRSRDENLVVDVESDLRLAQQRALLTGSAEPLLAALKSAETRLTRAAQPRLNPLQRAIARDIGRVKNATIADVPALMIKLDELARLVDELPVANEAVNNSVARPVSAVAAAPQRPASAAAGGSWLPGLDFTAVQSWSRRVAASLWLEASQLLRVSRIDQPEAALLAPEQAFFLRENLKLRLLNARLALLSRQTDAARSDLLNADAWLGRYFDSSARKTQAARELLVQVQGQLKSTELPRLDETLAALATAAAGR
ncbi:MAG: protein of unknown function hemX [Polaromonas sp.]|nr:protein of unknown function hemX [Polaromonas sp.]